MDKLTFFLLFFFSIVVSPIFGQPSVDVKSFDCTTFLRFCIGNDSSSINCPLQPIKGKKNFFEIQCKRIFFGEQVLRTTSKLSGSIIYEVQLELPSSSFEALDKKLSLQCAAITEKRTNSIITERFYSFVDGYRIKSLLMGNQMIVAISKRDEHSLIQNGKLELIPFYGFDIGEPTSLMRGYDVRGPTQRFSFRPNARVAGVELYSQFVKVDEKGIIKSMHLVTNPENKQDSDDLIAYFKKNSKRSKKKQSVVDKNTFRFINGYTITVLEENNKLYHFMITKSNNSSN
ncbi:MAG: hypothetical protein JNL36_09740 [Candidatus Kapabacteria bacterium]|nr:hypothetical protein [Candidatus Kapabacteria bacterium]